MNAIVPAPRNRDFWLSIGFVCLVHAGMAGYLALALGKDVVAWTMAAVCVLTIVGLVRGVRWGRRSALVLQWILLLVGLMTAAPPEAGLPEPQPILTLETVVVRMVLLSGVALLSLHLLGRHKKAFRADWW